MGVWLHHGKRMQGARASEYKPLTYQDAGDAGGVVIYPIPAWNGKRKETKIEKKNESPHEENR